MTGDDTLVQIRQISLNAAGLPDEVLILDPAGKPKYRGKFVYDPMGRILEEQSDCGVGGHCVRSFGSAA
mgnify:CR=1 FL=1